MRAPKVKHAKAAAAAAAAEDPQVSDAQSPHLATPAIPNRMQFYRCACAWSLTHVYILCFLFCSVFVVQPLLFDRSSFAATSAEVATLGASGLNKLDRKAWEREEEMSQG